MFVISPVLRLRVLLAAGLIALTSFSASQVAIAQANPPRRPASGLPNDGYCGTVRCIAAFDRRNH